MSHPVIVAARRTASGKFGGLLAKVPAPQLGAFVIEAMLADAPAAKAAIEECMMGNVLQAGVGQNPARQADCSLALPKR